MDITYKLISLLVYLPLVRGQDESSEVVSKAFITLGILSGALVISIIIAKIVDHCYDRSALTDNDSDISEHTKKLIRARLVGVKFPTKGEMKPITPSQRASRVIRIWSAKSKKRNSQIRIQSDVIINVDGADEEKDNNPFKLAFIDTASVTPEAKVSTPVKTDTNKPLTLHVPVEPELILLVSDTDGIVGTEEVPISSNDLPVIKVSEIAKIDNKPKITDPVPNENKPKTPAVAPVVTNDSPKKRATSAKTQNTKTIDAVRLNQSAGATKTVPRSPTKSSTPTPATPKFFPFPPKTPPLNKSKSVPHLNTKFVPGTPEASRSSSPPKILIKQPTELDFVPNLTTNITQIAKNAFERDTKGVVTSQPVSVQSPRPVSARPVKVQSTKPLSRVTSAKTSNQKQLTSTSAPSKVVSEKQGKKAVHFQSEPK